MKKTFCTLLMILFLCGCATLNPANFVNSINSVNYTTQSQQSNISSSLPATSANTVKDDAYYENLIKDIKYPEIYLANSDASLLDVVENFVYGFDEIFCNTEFSSPQELGDENIFYYFTNILDYDEFPESKEIINSDENGFCFFKQETIEKYAYYFFNYKIDCTKIEGWSEEKQGVYRKWDAVAGDRSNPEGDLKQLESGKYQFTADFKFSDSSYDYTLTAILGVENARVYLISLKRESINY